MLLLILNTDILSRETIPIKVHEHFHMQKPILAMVYHNEELKEMLKSYGHLPVNADDMDEIKNSIILCFDRWQKNELREKYLPSRLKKRLPNS